MSNGWRELVVPATAGQKPKQIPTTLAPGEGELYVAADKSTLVVDGLSSTVGA
jgi:hypothetical protein